MRTARLARIGLVGVGLLARAPGAPSPLAPTLFAQQPAPLPLKHAPQPTTPAITTADLMTRLYIYADDSLMGREVGTPYHLKATAYIEREVRRLGLQPGGDGGTYFQNLPVFNETVARTPSLSVDGRTFSGLTDFIPRDNAVFGAPVRPLDGTQVVYGGTYSPSGDTSMMLSPIASLGKFVVIGVPNGPDGKPLWGNNRQQLTVRYLMSNGIGVVSLDAIPDSEKPTILAPILTFKNNEGDLPQLPAFLYISKSMAEALMGAPLAGLTRGTQGKTLRGEIK
jgi:hypothetical protein